MMGHDYYMVCLSCKVRTASLGKLSELQANISEWPKIFSFLEAHQGHPISFLHDEDIRDWDGAVFDWPVDSLMSQNKKEIETTAANMRLVSEIERKKGRLEGTRLYKSGGAKMAEEEEQKLIREIYGVQP
ncbi:MAG: hypothetical protein J7L32_05295 [Thermoplasmata archaeon]|nr:hypothetical protein [Thermoplasmata archaeon]